MKTNLITLIFGFTVLFANAQNEFITTWKTDNLGVSADNQITIPTFPFETYNYTVVWGDGTTDTGVTGDITHTYSATGTYTVRISGVFPRIYFNDTAFLQVVGDEEKLESIEQWGSNTWTSMDSAFAGCTKLKVNAVDMPDLSNLQSLRRMFFWTGFPLNIPNIENWDVSNITDLSGMFDKTSFIQDISGWDVSNVTDMSYLFFSSPFNQDISNWDVSNVTNMAGMFGSGSFRQDVTVWDVSSVTNMDFMFNSTFFDQDISSWDVSNVTSMRHMLSQCSFNQDISSWNVGQVADMSNIFDDNDLSRENYDKILIAWSQLPSLRFGTQLGAKDVNYCLGKEARALLISTYNWTIIDQGENCEAERPFITTWKTDNPGVSQDNQITIPTNPREVYNYNVSWGDGTSDTGITADITHTYSEPGIYEVSITGRFPAIYFNGGTNITQHPSKNADTKKILLVNQWGTNEWISLSFAFAGCSNLDVIATDTPDLSKDVFLSGMFLECTSLKGNEYFAQWDLDFISFTASNMFNGATQFNQPLDQWDVSKLRYLNSMFEGATLFNQNLASWNIEKVENFDRVFDDSGLSTENYDAILIGWSQGSSVLSGVKFGANNTPFCDGETARQNLIDNYGWIIDDAGKNPNCNLDNDDDGVLDHLDACLGTPQGDTVYANGCTVLSANNFTVETIGETCPDKNNAQINIVAVLAYDFVATINGTAYDFTDSLTVGDLNPGTYDVCISFASESFEQCYVLELVESANITGKSSKENGKMAIEIDQGTAPFNVKVNGTLVLSTSARAFTIDAKEGDFVEVVSDKICEGSFSEMMENPEASVAYPNPTSGSFEISVPMVQTEIEVEVLSMHSQLLFIRTYPVSGGSVSVNIEDLPSGMYLIKVRSANPKIYKIIKR